MELSERPIPGPPRDFIGYGRKRPKVQWPNGAAVAVSLVVNYEAGSEYSFTVGDDRREMFAELGTMVDADQRDYCIESVFEYESHAGVWRMLRLFQEYEIKTTFFAAAVALERNPEVAASISDGGHEPCGHGWRWLDQWRLTEEEEREQIRRTAASFEKTCGTRPQGWYTRYSASSFTRQLLVEEGGFLYDSDAYNDDIPYFVDVNGREHLVIPYNTLPTNDVRFVAPQGYAAGSDFVETCTRSIDELAREGAAGYGSVISIGLHPRWSGQPARASALREFIEYCLNRGDVWFARRVDVARWWLDNRPGG